MSNETINRLTIIAAGILAIIVFAGLSVRHNIPVIEMELAQRATTALQQSRMSWAKVDVSGRDLTLSGVAPDAQARDAAIAKAFIWGVRQVESQLDTVMEYVSEGVTPQTNQDSSTSKSSQAAAPVAKPHFRTRLIVSDHRLILDGAVPGERQRRELIELAQAQFSVAAVEASLQAQSDPPDHWLRAIALGLEVAELLVMGEVILVDQSLHVMGITATAQGDQKIRQILTEQLPDGYSGTAETGVRAELEAVLRTSPELAQRLARRSATTGRVDLPTPRVLSDSGCASVFRNTLTDREVRYATASATLTADSMQLLDELAAVLKRCSGLRIAIHGHTDDQGLMENNLSLSQRRAESVMQHFVSRGISLSRMSAQGFGEEQPLMPNETAADRAINRRIEFVFDIG